MRKENWNIEISGDRFVFTRIVKGRVDESYAPVDQAKASVFAASIIQGFQPPRVLQNSDTPID